MNVTVFGRQKTQSELQAKKHSSERRESFDDGSRINDRTPIRMKNARSPRISTELGMNNDSKFEQEENGSSPIR
jgi:hypothetical protein